MLDVDDLYALYFQMEADEEYYDELEPMTGAQRTGGVGACWHALLSCPEQGPTATSVMSAIMRADDGALGSDAVGGSEAVTAINDPQLQQAIRDSKITAGLEEADRADAAAVVSTLVQEHELEWEHEGRSGGESTLKEASHAALMQHNYSNVK